MKKVILILLSLLMLTSCGYEKADLKQPDLPQNSGSSKNEPLLKLPEKEPEMQKEPERERIKVNCLGNFTCHESDLVFELVLPEGWNYNGGVANRDRNKVGEFFMRCDKTYEEWRENIDPSAKDKEIGGRVFSVFSYEQGMMSYDEDRPKEINTFELTKYEYHNGSHLYIFFLYENKDYDEEFSEEFEKMLETFEPAEGRDCGLISKDGRISGIIHPAVLYSPEREKAFEDELVDISALVPEGWMQETIGEEGKIYGITFTMPWDERFKTYFFVYKDDGTVFEHFYNEFSWNLKINDSTFNEVSGNFSKGIYIRADGPAKNLGDSENWFRTSTWFYVLQFDGYVAVLHQNVRLDEGGVPFAEHEKMCNDFAASIKIG